MRVYIGADYRGFERKAELVEFLRGAGYEVEDLGAHEKVEGDDFNEPARAVSEAVRGTEDGFGILICDSAHGVTMQANRFTGVRAANCDSTESARLAREHDSANVLCMSAHFIDEAAMQEIAVAFLTTDFAPLERRIRRIQRLDLDVDDYIRNNFDGESNI